MRPHTGRVAPEQRFWKLVDKNGPMIIETQCWVWIGSKNGTGYPQFWLGRGKYGYAHRYSYELHYGPVPDGKLVMHRCDNPPCIRPEHLRPGTDIENLQDASRKGRLGGSCPRYKDVVSKDIRAAFGDGVSRNDLLKKHGMSPRTLRNILRGDRLIDKTSGSTEDVEGK